MGHFRGLCGLIALVVVLAVLAAAVVGLLADAL
jgi:hypothetical protein